jgi:predicted dehydrogenase
MKGNRAVDRRRFLKTAAAAAVGAPWILPSSAVGLDGAAAPSERIALAAIGLGHRNRSNLSHFLAQQDVQCLAVCDCFADRRNKAKEMVDRHYGNKDCVTTRLHEEVLQRGDIDAVLIGTGDRWHTPLSILAAKAGKDVYCEKPFSLTIGEGRRLVEITKRYGTVWQCGTQRRSNSAYAFVAEGIKAGMVGKLHTITASYGGWLQANRPAPVEPEPDRNVFDYNRWLGQAPWAPYSGVRVALWRHNWDTGGGVIADMGPHYIDFAQWAHDSETSGPVEFEGTASWLGPGFANVPASVNVTARYADGVILKMDSGPKGVKFAGDEGWVHLSDLGEITAEPRSILRTESPPKVHWAYMEGHVRNFLNCIKSRRLTASHPEIAHRAHTVAHCANICLRLGRKVRWDPKTENFIYDNQANRMSRRVPRPPWQV